MEPLPPSVLHVAIAAASLGTGVLCVAFGWQSRLEDRHVSAISLALGIGLIALGALIVL